MILVYVLSSAESLMKPYSLPLWFTTALPFCAAFRDISPIDEIGTEAGAVKYQISFPSRADFLNVWANDVPPTETSSNPAGGAYGLGASKVTALVVGCFAGCLGPQLVTVPIKLLHCRAYFEGVTVAGDTRAASSSSSSSLLFSLSSLSFSLSLPLPLELELLLPS